MATIKKGDFVELNYTAKVKDDDIVFDTTIAEKAKEHNIYDSSTEYKPRIICVGEKQVTEGIDDELVGKETGKGYSVELDPEKGFGRKNAKLLQLIPTSKFTKENIRPVPGLQVSVDGMMGTVKTVAGGRTIVDFNHPLSGKELVYEIKAERVVTGAKEKAEAIIKEGYKIADSEIDYDEGGKRNILKITTKTAMPQEVKDAVSKKIKELIAEIKKIEFKSEDSKEERIKGRMSEERMSEENAPEGRGSEEKQSSSSLREKRP